MSCYFEPHSGAPPVEQLNIHDHSLRSLISNSPEENWAVLSLFGGVMRKGIIHSIPEI